MTNEEKSAQLDSRSCIMKGDPIENKGEEQDGFHWNRIEGTLKGNGGLLCHKAAVLFFFSKMRGRIS